MNIVIDTNVLLSALLTLDGKAHTILDKLLNGHFVFLYNDIILQEYKDVLSRKRFKLNKKDISSIVSFIRLKGINVFKYTKSTIKFIDESDRIFYDIAMSMDSMLITGNLKHFPKHKHIVTIEEFCNRFC